MKSKISVSVKSNLIPVIVVLLSLCLFNVISWKSGIIIFFIIWVLFAIVTLVIAKKIFEKEKSR